MRLPIIERRVRIARPRDRGASTYMRGITHAPLCVNAIRRGDGTAVVIGRDIIIMAHLTMIRES